MSAIGREGTWPVVLEVQAFFDRQRAEALDDANAQGDAPGARDPDDAGA